MPDSDPQLDSFFSAYEKRTNDALTTGKADLDGTAGAFAGCFVESAPTGVICGSNGKEFRQDMEKGYAFYRSLGTQWMRIMNKEITRIDALHTMTKVFWQTSVIKKDGSEVKLDFHVIYFTRLENSAPKIFAYIAGDEQGLYKQHGIEPYKK